MGDELEKKARSIMAVRMTAKAWKGFFAVCLAMVILILAIPLFVVISAWHIAEGMNARFGKVR